MSSSNTKESENWFDSFAGLMDQNIRGVQYGVYCVAGLGLAIALRSVRPFTKFVKPSDIPKQFMQKKMKFNGTVCNIQTGAKIGDNPVLLIDHIPVVAVPFRSPGPVLPVQVSSVQVSSNGVSWMQSLLVGSKVSFIPLRTDSKVVHAVVLNAKNENIGHHLVTIGFGTVDCLDLNLEKDPTYLKYYKGLLASEQKAERKGAGLWMDRRPSVSRILTKRLKAITGLSFL